MAAPPVEAAPPVAAAAAALAKNDYGIMWYKSSTSIGIRAKFGAKGQVLSFGGTRCTKSKHTMKTFAKEIVADLQAGMSPEDAKKKGMKFAFPDD